jgi:hypothetical protein
MPPGEDRCKYCGAVVGTAGKAEQASGEPAGLPGTGAGQEPGAYFTGTGVRGRASDDRYPWPGKKGFWSSTFQQTVTWFVGHLWWVIGGIVVLLALVALFFGPGAWDLLAGLILLLLAGFSLLRRGFRRLPLAVLLVGIAVALFTIGGRAMLARHTVAVQTPSQPAGGQAVPNVQQNNANSSVAWQKTISLPQSPVGLGQGGSDRIWAFEAQRPILPVDGIALLNESTGSTVFSKDLGTSATAYIVDSQGNAWVAEDESGQETLFAYSPGNPKATSYSLPGSISKVVGLTDTSEGIWPVIEGPGTAFGHQVRSCYRKLSL